MNATERARRSDALYRDDATMHRRDLCDMVAQREAEIAELRERIDEAHMSRLLTENENESLRELASGLRQCLDDQGCEGCPMQDDDGWCVRDIRLRELGVEVDR